MDLNSDLGEGFGAWALTDDAALLEIVSSANVACGFHAGDPHIMRRVCAQAVARGVAIGAQVSYRDLAGFGRRFIDVDPVVLADEVLYQIGALEACARAAGGRVAYVKPHGALYNVAVADPAHAGAVVDGVRAFGGLPVLGLPGSQLLASAERAGLRPVREAFADRAYLPDGGLVPRAEPDAVLTDPVEMSARVLRLLERGELVAVDGSVLTGGAESLCVHGDTQGAVALAAAVRDTLLGAGHPPAPFA